jgi:molybdopterin/thiamine biosynthesis adenylyltransferase
LEANSRFDYARAFSRNIGWVTPAEQERLRQARVAIAGLGGVGGTHLLTLARLGVSKFNIADFDDFEVHNFNRQVGATMSSLGRPKAEVLAEMARDINPQADIRVFPAGVSTENVGDFLSGVDVYVDGIDIFAIDARRLLFNLCGERGIPALTAAPLGMGVSLLYFKPGSMSFEQYFRLEGHDKQEQYARFIAGLSPAMLQRSYLVVPESVNFPEKRGPSTMMACELCAGVMGTSVLKVILGRGALRPAPWSLQFDAYRQQLRFAWRPLGNANPLQQLLLRFIRPVLRGIK